MNTINNVPRELLADLLGNDHDKRIMAERHLLAMLANAPSPAGVDGLSVVAYRVSLPGEPELGTWLDEDAENEPQMCLHEPLCRLSDALAAIAVRDARIVELEADLTGTQSRVLSLQNQWRKLDAELAAIKAQEPVAYIPVDRETGEEWHPVLKKGSGNICDYKPLYAAPAAPAAYAVASLIEWTKDAVEWGGALNYAAWEFVNECPEKSALLFNNTKGPLRAAIMKYAEIVAANDKDSSHD